jgi:hypothetical protein
MLAGAAHKCSGQRTQQPVFVPIGRHFRTSRLVSACGNPRRKRIPVRVRASYRDGATAKLTPRRFSRVAIIGACPLDPVKPSSLGYWPSDRVATPPCGSCAPVSNSNGHAACLPIRAISPPTTSKNLSRYHRRGKRLSAQQKKESFSFSVA